MPQFERNETRKTITLNGATAVTTDFDLRDQPQMTGNRWLLIIAPGSGPTSVDVQVGPLVPEIRPDEESADLLFPDSATLITVETGYNFDTYQQYWVNLTQVYKDEDDKNNTMSPFGERVVLTGDGTDADKMYAMIVDL